MCYYAENKHIQDMHKSSLCIFCTWGKWELYDMADRREVKNTFIETSLFIITLYRQHNFASTGQFSQAWATPYNETFSVHPLRPLTLWANPPQSFFSFPREMYGKLLIKFYPPSHCRFFRFVGKIFQLFGIRQDSFIPQGSLQYHPDSSVSAVAYEFKRSDNGSI